MDAMAAMFARMIGMKPDEMQGHFTSMQEMVLGTAEKVSAIHEMAVANAASLERIENAIRDRNLVNGNSNGSGKRGRSARDSNSGPAPK